MYVAGFLAVDFLQENLPYSEFWVGMFLHLPFCCKMEGIAGWHRGVACRKRAAQEHSARLLAPAGSFNAPRGHRRLARRESDMMWLNMAVQVHPHSHTIRVIQMLAHPWYRTRGVGWCCRTRRNQLGSRWGCAGPPACHGRLGADGLRPHS